MPGMGGPFDSRNFIHNCDDWSSISFGSKIAALPQLRLAPITGAIENVGYPDEKSFYMDLIRFACERGIKLSIGDGTPDFKLQYGIEAVREQQKTLPNLKAAVFIKPYPNEKILERSAWASDIAEIYGIDIDAYNIITMRNLVHLEQKSPAMLLELKKKFNAKGAMFAIKGVFKDEDIETVKEVKPDIIYISNHGGRVETREGSTANFLEAHAATLSANCHKLWIDGGIRLSAQMKKAASHGVDTVLLGRPIVSALCSEKAGEERPVLQA
ncbi:MAG: alpha-hydroxy-acid oxidizing protein [Treponema sp.]|nr:alpha-hydroxy-acid oxidizing protein [Treponema sp.]